MHNTFTALLYLHASLRRIILLMLCAWLAPAFAQSIDLNRAITIATNQFPDTSLVEAELERERGRLVWDIKLSNGMAVYVDANSGNIVEIDSWDDDWDEDDDWYEYSRRNNNRGQNAGSSNAAISLEQAISIAQNQFPNARVVEVDRDNTRSRLLWDVKLSNGRAVYVDANNGNIVEIESWR